MLQPNRKKEPSFRNIEKFSLPKAEKFKLDNGVPVCAIKSGTQDIIRIEFIFKAGKWYEKSNLTASATNAMLNEGTPNHSSVLLAGKFDYYGSYIHLYSEADRAGLVLFTLSKYVLESLILVEDILKNSIFPEKEIDIFLQRSKQSFLVNRSKVSFLAREGFLSALFGSFHPYGRPIKLEDFDKLNRRKIVNHFLNFYQGVDTSILVSGKWSFSLKETLNRFFGANDRTGDNAGIYSGSKEKSLNLPPVYKKNASHRKRLIVEKKDAVQSAIKIGKTTISRTHNDYFGLRILITVLGGYFGSRLMKNIREDKGYTYGISAQLISMEKEGYISISSEVGTDVCKKAIKEVYKEIDRLTQEPVSKVELSLVRNYMLGNWLRMFDGPLAIADSYRVLIDNGLEEDYFERGLKEMQNIKSEQLSELALRYFKKDSFIEIVAGIYK